MFDRILARLIDQYGRPSQLYEKSKPGADMIQDINDGVFVRLAEWLLPGGTLRFGIPKRVDGQVRMELQLATGFPSPEYTLWSLEGVK